MSSTSGTGRCCSICASCSKPRHSFSTGAGHFEGGAGAMSGGKSKLCSRFILGMRVDCTSYADATGRILDWARAAESRAVCIATVNNVMESHDSREVREAMNGADMVTPDGMPLVWGL